MKKLVLLEDIQKSDIKESWSWDILKMMDEVKELQRKIRLAKKERLLQPTLVVQSAVMKAFYKIYQYQIINYEESKLCAEAKEEMTDKEVEEFFRGRE